MSADAALRPPNGLALSYGPASWPPLACAVPGNHALFSLLEAAHASKASRADSFNA